MTEQLPACLNATQDDITKLLSSLAHLGTTSLTRDMEPYLWKRRVDGVNIIDFFKTWNKIVLAARVIAAVENPADVAIVSSRPFGQRAALKFQQYVGCQAIVGRFTPGTFTNYVTRTFKEPRLLLVTDPRADHQSVVEASYASIPVVALCNTDTSLKFVDVAIPCNNAGKFSTGLVMWLLAREVLRIKGAIMRDAEWSVMPDMFFYREPEEAEREAEEAKAKLAAAAPGAPVPAEKLAETQQLLDMDGGVPSKNPNWDGNDWAAAPAEAPGGGAQQAAEWTGSAAANADPSADWGATASGWN